MTQPNILFLFPDQQRPDWLGVNEDLPVRTPNLDRLCEQGVRFTNCLTPSPVCAPARACLAAGKNYDRCGVPGNGTAYPLNQPTFYQALRDAGYRVAGCGKFDLDKPTLEWNLDGSRLIKDWGFTEGVDNEGKFDGSRSYRMNDNTPVGPYLRALHDAGVADQYCNEHASCKENMGAYTTVVPDDLYCDNWLSDIGLQFLHDFPRDQPWFIQVNFTGPHNPMDVTPSMRERWEDVAFPEPHNNEHPDREGLQRVRQNYAAMIENIDRQIGRFIDVVKERGELDNTLIVFASDHGEMLDDHSRRGKSTWRFAAAGVPLIVAGPGVQSGIVSDVPVGIHDLAPTFIDYAGANPMPDMDAISLKDLLDGRTDKHRDYITSGLQDWRLAYDGRYKLVVQPDAEPLLFDRHEDPWEDHSIAADHPELLSRLQSVIAAAR